MKFGCEHWGAGHEPEWISRVDAAPVAACPKCNPTGAHLLKAEVLLLYAFVFALRPHRAVEIGSLYGGSARIIAQAMIDAGRPPTPETLFLIDPAPRFTQDNKAFLASKSTMIEQASPQAFKLLNGAFDFALLDGDHSEEAVRDDIHGLSIYMNVGGYILCHDAFNEQTRRGIDKGIAVTGLIDCGMMATTPQTDTSDEMWGGLRVLRRG
jgi:predicted O-methyltransferase YrrM